MAMEINRLAEPLGAEAVGLDLREKLTEQTIEELKQAILDHHLLVIRDQPIEPPDHRRFCELFGEIQAQRVTPELQPKDQIGMMFVGNAREDAMLQNGEMWLHSDQCYFETPNKFTSLQAVTVTKSGGNTRFANCRKAYEALSDDIKESLDGLRAMNCYDYNEENMHIKTAPRQPDSPRYVHPIVRTHPDTGKKSLYLNRLITDYIVDFDEAESHALLEQLFDHVESDQFVYEHKWRVGDVSIWDNRCLLHGRTDFDPNESRLLRRFCVIGDTPF